MGVPYRFFYRLGFHPWEDLVEHPPFADKLAELFAREESGRTPPYGPALDLGCGSGVWGVKLAQRGRQGRSPTSRSPIPTRTPSRGCSSSMSGFYRLRRTQSSG